MTSPNHPSSKWADKKIFTTGEAAEVCKVSQQTIIRCFDAGRLGGFKVPGSTFRRIPREDLLRFMAANGIPADALDGPRRRVLVIDDGREAHELLEWLSASAHVDAKSADNSFDAGALVESFRPQLVFMNVTLTRVDVPLVCNRLRGRGDDAPKVVLSGPAEREGEAVRLLVGLMGEYLARPVDSGRLASCLARWTDAASNGRSEQTPRSDATLRGRT